MMVRLTSVLVALFSLTLLSSCEWAKPQYENILMENCGRNGLQDFKIVTGKVNTWGPCTELIAIPAWEKRIDLDPVVVTCSDGGTFTVDPTYAFQLIRGKGPDVAFNYRQYGGGDELINQIALNVLSPRVLNAYRETARDFTTDSLMRNMNRFEKIVEARLGTEFEAAYFTRKDISSGLTPPESMRQAIERRNEMRLQAERTRLELEQARAKLEVAKLEAEADRVRSAGYTGSILAMQMIEKWNGSQPLWYGEPPTFFKEVK
jgi:regulator of protease activity HflC (stomatin/prohibitin superfamily)